MKCSTVEVPHLGTSVQVQLIPLKLLRAIQMKVTKDGRIDFQELMVWKLVYGLRDSNFTEAEARRLTQRFTLRVLQPIVDEIDRLSGTDEHLSDSDRPAAVRKITEPMTMATAWVDRFPEVVPTKARSRESHGSQPGRRRGSRRGERATSSSSDDPDPDPEPAERRLCENKRCERDISRRHPLARYCDDACQQEALRDRRTLELLDEIVGTIAEGLSCACEPKRNTLEPGHCWQCGYSRDVVTREWVHEDGAPARSFVVTRGLPSRDLRVRPDRKLSAKLRETRAGRNRQPAPRVVRVFTNTELEAIAAELAPAHRPLPMFASATGLRTEEWAALEPRDIDRHARVLTVRRTISSGELVELGKTTRSRREVPLSTRALEALDAVPPRLDTPLLFPAARGGLLNLDNWRRREWAPAIEAGGIRKPARIYDLRSTFASNALAAGVSVFELARIMGTSTHMIERSYGVLIEGAGAGIASRLDAFDVGQERAAEDGR